VKNDSQDRDFNVVQVSGGGRSYALRPGEFALLPGGTRAITFSRQYRDHTKTYQVECPSRLTRGITIKLIDVHLDRIAGGCRTVSSSR
jgi:hypothetical protein